MNKIIVLGIESSCDDTSVAIVDEHKNILAHKTYHQYKEHAKYKGVVPEIAARSHITHLKKLVEKVVNVADIELSDISAIAATGGPGLIGGVIVGTMFAKGLAASINKPFIAVNHLEGHALTVRLTDNISMPYLLLLASGGHCQFIKVKELGDYQILGQTLDDAIGESFDKVAKMLNLPYPGGPEVEKHAKFGENCYKLPLPIINDGTCNLSFSGLKTAVKILIKSVAPMNKQKVNNICASFQHTVSEVICRKSLNAISVYESEGYNKNFVFAGGVAANIHIRQRLESALQKVSYRLVTPPVNLCTDNAAMIAWVGIERYRQGLFNDLAFAPKARWSLESL